MTNQYIWIGVTVAVFLAGIGIGYSMVQSSVQPNFNNMTPQQMQQMMNNPQAMNQWHQNMMNNPQEMEKFMTTMMNDPQTMQQMHSMMMNDPQHMENMMNDPNHMTKMADMMKSNPQMRSHMMGLMNGTMGNMAGMGPGMMQP